MKHEAKIKNKITLRNVIKGLKNKVQQVIEDFRRQIFY